MFDFRQYIITVAATSAVGCIFVAICNNKGTTFAIIKLIVGILMTVTILKPVLSLELDGFLSYINTPNRYVTEAVIAGSEWSDSQTVAIIKEQLEAYILDKALALGASLDVSVTLSEQAPFGPHSIIISGNVSPYVKSQLSEIIVTDLGVSMEKQTWKH